MTTAEGMAAVVLVGGEGTRLRPLTETIPKPLLDFLDRPFLDTVLDHLATHGVPLAVLSSPYLEATFAPFLASREGRAPSVSWITEPEPLGTGGAVANAADVAGLRDPFLVLNGDILTDLDLGALVQRHAGTEATATITLTHVEDARPYGLVTTEGTRIREFREKPAERVAGWVNAGTYVLAPDALASVAPGAAASIERDVFPGLIAAGRTVTAFPSDAYWQDLGTPERYLEAHADAMAGRVSGIEAGDPRVAPSARVDPDARLHAGVAVGRDAVIEAGCELARTVVLAGASLRAGSTVTGSIVGPGAEVGEGAAVSDAVLAEGSRVPPGASASGSRVGPGQVLTPEPA